MATKDIWVGIIENSDGTNMYASWNKEGLLEQFDEYVKYWWDRECGAAEMPLTVRERFNAYFEIVDDEYYNWDKVKIEDEDKKIKDK